MIGTEVRSFLADHKGERIGLEDANFSTYS